MQAKACFPYTLITATALVALSACATPPPGPTYDQYVGRWVEDTEINLVSAWGIPKQTHALETGGRIVEYTKTQEADVVCTTRFTVDDDGRIVKYWYRGSSCKAPTGV